MRLPPLVQFGHHGFGHLPSVGDTLQQGADHAPGSGTSQVPLATIISMHSSSR